MKKLLLCVIILCVYAYAYAGWAPSVVSDEAYDATTWNGVTKKAPSKNAVRDKIETLGTGNVTSAGFAAKQILFGSSTTAVAGVSTFIWNTTDSRLGIGTATPECAFDFATSQANIQDIIHLYSAAANSRATGFGLGAADSRMLIFAGDDGDIVGFGAIATNGVYTERVTYKTNGFVGIGNTAPAGVFVVTPPVTETIVADAIITTNACGTIKQITAAGAVTTNTTNTFTAPADANNGCIMSIINVGTNAITLDVNANFVSAGAANVVLGAGDTCTVASTGASGKWYQIGDTGNN